MINPCVMPCVMLDKKADPIISVGSTNKQQSSKLKIANYA